MEFSLLAAAAVATGAFWVMLRWEAKRGNAAGCALDLWEAGITAAVAGVFIGRLTSMASAGINPFTDPGQILLVRSGVSTVGAALGTLAAYLFLARLDIVGGFDAIAAAAVAALAGWHAGCLATDGCLGTASTLPWAISLEGSTVTRHPVELYAAILLAAAAFGIALWRQYGTPPPLGPGGVALLAASGVRLVTEPLRISLSGGPILFYAAGCAVGVALIVGSVLARQRRGGSSPPPLGTS